MSAQTTDRTQDIAANRCQRDCEALYVAFANALDVRDYDRVISLFATDATMNRKGSRHVGRDAIMAMLLARPANRALRHLISNVEIFPIGDDAARGVCYFLAFAEPGADDGEYLPMNGPSVMGELHGEFRRTNDGWKFSRFDAKLTFAREGV
jgi:hypothetical protein